MKELLNDLLSNRILLVSMLSWFVAQFIKMILYLIMNRELKIERMVGSGGMPSSHAATVCALATSSLLTYGLASFQFAVTFILMTIVLHDARGVRLETGKQATILNRMIEIYNTDNKIVFPKLKELVGHTPLQVLIGALLGIMIAVIFR